MRVFTLPGLLLTLLLQVSWSQAASVTEWGGAAQQTNRIFEQLLGRWHVAAVYHDNQNMTNEEDLGDYWVFRSNGFVEHAEHTHGLRRSTFYVNGRDLTVRDRRTRTERQMFIKFIDHKRLIWDIRVEGKTITYNLERH